MAKRKTRSQDAENEVPSDLTAEEISGMDGAAGTNVEIIVYPIPLAAIGELDYAVRFMSAKFYHSGVTLLDFDMAAYERHSKGLAPAGRPDSLAFRHKRTGKTQAGVALVDPNRSPFPHYPTGDLLVGNLAVEDE